ncbi:MAG TPA: tyrosine-protein phosphatase [Methylomirabilota bacterium]|nr:tyrosine-protein phosphatase [Methylomirabilota bacterium]
MIVRHIPFESVPNFRDLGGYRTHDGRTVAWRRLFRSAALHKMNDRDIARLKQEIDPRAVIDLRRLRDHEKNPEPLLLEEIGARYYPLPFRPDSPSYLEDEAKAIPNVANLGEIYLYRISEPPFGKRLVDALEIIAERNNHPVVFHCTAGKDRTGVLAAMVLAAVGVVDEDVVGDYALSAPLMKDIRDRMNRDPETAQAVKDLPDLHWEASAESMAAFLALLRREYGSVDGYLKANGARSSLVDRLKGALLV